MFKEHSVLQSSNPTPVASRFGRTCSKTDTYQVPTSDVLFREFCSMHNDREVLDHLESSGFEVSHTSFNSDTQIEVQ